MAKGQYYGFKAQEDAQVINWASVAKGLGDTLTEEAKRREDKKKSINDASENLGDFIANSPLGGHEGAVASTADLANQAQEMRLMQDRMLKSGELGIRDYNTMRGNLEKDVKTLYQSADEFQKMYAEDVKRSGPGGSAALQETWMNSQLEGFLNPSNTKYRFNPRTGELMIGTLDADGNLDQSTMRPMSAIQNDVRTRVNALDVPQAVSNITKQLPGKFKQAVMQGKVSAIEGFVDKKEFQSAIDNAASSLIVDPSSAASVLTNYLGEYGVEDFTTNPNEKGDDKILMIPNPQNPGSGAMVPDLTDNQKAKAKEAIKEAFLLSIGYKETPRKDPREFRLTGPEIAQSKQKEKEDAFVGHVTGLIEGEKGQFESSANTLINLYNRNIKDPKKEEKLSSIKRTANGFEVVYEDYFGDTRTQPINLEGKTNQALVTELLGYATPLKEIAAIGNNYNLDNIQFNVKELGVETAKPEEVVEDVSESLFVGAGKDGSIINGLQLFTLKNSGSGFKEAAQTVLEQKLKGKNITVKREGGSFYKNEKLKINIDGKEFETPFNYESISTNMNNIQKILDIYEGKQQDSPKKKLPGT